MDENIEVTETYDEIVEQYLKTEAYESFKKFMRYLESINVGATDIWIEAVHGRVVRMDKRFEYSPAFQKLSKKYQDDLSKKNEVIERQAKELKELRSDKFKEDIKMVQDLKEKHKKEKDEMLVAFENEKQTISAAFEEEKQKIIDGFAEEKKTLIDDAKITEEYYEKEYDALLKENDKLLAVIKDLQGQLEKANIINTCEPEVIVDDIKPVESDKPTPPIIQKDFTLSKNKGKAVELSRRMIREIVRLHCMGKSIPEIVKETGATRRQVDRLVKGKLEHKRSREKVLDEIKKLLKVNQNKQMIEKLNRMKSMYYDYDEVLE